VSSNVQPEEAAAIRELVEAGGTAAVATRVERRNFAEPRRLSADALRRLGREIAALLPATSSELAATLRRNYKLALASIAEISAKRLFHGLPAPFLVWCFECGGQLGWLAWDSAAANRLLETILCGKCDEKAPARRFSPLECQVLERVFGTLVGGIARELELEPKPARLAQAEDELDGYEGVGGNSDTQRLMVHLSLDGPGGASDVRIYLPGVFVSEGEDEAARKRPLATLPEHVHGVSVELFAYLGSIDVPLQELLGLEVGDVLPLALGADAPLQLFVEDRPCARAALGKRKGKLAVKVLELDPAQHDIDQPPQD
jgi:flagellar motor switch protein FliM